jgi:hypothetical protein
VSARADAIAGVLLVAVVTACAVVLAFFAALLVPLRAGTVIVPVAVPLAAATTWSASAVLRRAGLPQAACLPPLAGWFAAIVAVGAQRSEGDVLLPGGTLSWVSYGVMFGGAVAGVIGIALPRRRVESGA